VAVPGEDDDGPLGVALEILHCVPGHGGVPEELRFAEGVDVPVVVTAQSHGTPDELPVILADGASDRGQLLLN